MRVFYTATGVSNYCKEYPQNVGFVPTMGALHEGHLDLVRSAKSQKKVVVVSVFVNPKQFNNPEDLKKYPRTILNDLRLLNDNGVDAVFVPSVDEIYPAVSHEVELFNQTYETKGIILGEYPNQEESSKRKETSIQNQYILQGIDGIWEGEFRPGHFSGVVDVVRRLFEIIMPESVYFGEKDLQQCLVIHRLIQLEFPKIKMNYVPTKRESSGLAMSSRNLRLSENAQIQAAHIFKSLSFLEQQFKLQWKSLSHVDRNIGVNDKSEINNIISNSSAAQSNLEQSKIDLNTQGISCEYLNLILLPSMVEVSDLNDLIDSTIIKPIKLAIIFSGYLEGVRLIDNLTFELD
jgi:pantoate--beta-alanine ligase